MAEEVITEENSGDDSETKIYEIGFHLLSSVEEGDVAVEVTALKSSIENHRGIFVAEEFPKPIQLAYTMIKAVSGKQQRFNNAYFGWIKFEMKPEDIAGVKADMDNNKNILRYIIIKTVRESTLAPRSAIFAKEGVTVSQKKKPDIANKEKDKVPVSEEELDRTIEELIVE